MMIFLQLTLLTLFIASPASLIHAENVITCGRNIQRLACARGVIKVQSAFYGRSSSDICCANQPPYRLANIWCRSTISAIPARCNGRKVCEFNANIVGRFDPCPGTSKYFSTTYTCIKRRPWNYRCPGCVKKPVIYRPPIHRPWNHRCPGCVKKPVIYRPPIHRPWNYRCPGCVRWPIVYRAPIHKEVVACEHSNAVLTCGRHRTIRVHSANYGRTDYNTCRRIFFWFYNTRCYQRHSTARVVNRCNGSRTCVVPATNQFFSDPCFGTFKYLKVSYACV